MEYSVGVCYDCEDLFFVDVDNNYIIKYTLDIIVGTFSA